MKRFTFLYRALCALALTTAVGSAANAQPAPDATQDAATGDAAPAAVPTMVPESDDTSALDQRLLKYWGTEMREVESLQKRLYRKDQRHEFSFFVGVIPNDEFQSYYPLGVRWDYFFAEDFAIEVGGSYMIGVDSGLAKFLEDITSGSLKTELPESLKWQAAADFVWSPIQGKFGIFGTTLTHFDMYMPFGVGVMGTEVTNLQRTAGRVAIAAHVGIGARVWFSQQFTGKFEVRQYFFPAEGGGMSHPVEISLSFGFMTKSAE